MAPAAAFAATGALLYGVALVWAGSARTFAAIAGIGSVSVVAGTALASSAYLLRFARWQFLLRALGHRLPPLWNLRVYLAGLVLTSTPAKLGETLRSVLLLQRGVPLPAGLAAFFADRLSDVIGVALLGAVCARLGGTALPALDMLAASAFGSSVLAAWLLRRQRWQAALQRPVGPGRWLSRLAALASPALTWAGVWSMRTLAWCVLCAFLAYGVQALVFTGYLAALGADLAWARCVAIFATATLLGAASMVPAGLGVMDAALVVQLVDAGVARDAAVAAAVLTRLSTLWFGLLLGSAMLMSFARADRATDEHPNDCF